MSAAEAARPAGPTTDLVENARSGRLAWVDDGEGAPASVTTLVTGVGSCAVAVWACAEEPAVASGAVLVLVSGAAGGRILRLDRWFRPTAAWMWAVGLAMIGALLSAGFNWRPLWSAGLALALFVLPLDWRCVPRLRASVAAGTVFATLAVTASAGPRPGVLWLWAPLAMLALLLIERDAGRAGHAGPVPRRAGRTAGDGAVLGGVALAAVVVAVTVLPPAPPEPAPGRAGRGGEGDPSYWGFSRELDTGVRSLRGDDVVARVRATTPALWRGDSFDRFDGRRWTHGHDLVEVLRGDPLSVPAPSSRWPGSAPAVPADDQVQVFIFEQGGNDLVFAANRPRIVTAGSTVTWAGEAESLRIDRPLGRGGSYTVVSARPRVTAQLLRSLDGAQTDALAASAGRGGAGPLARYLAVPVSTTPRTHELAARVTAGAATTYDRVKALEGWLGANTSYRLDLPPLPPGRDAVDQYLFEDRQGYCEQIASALAVMLRILGVPTRLAVGLVSDHQDAVSGEWIVRERDAHAWVEVWWPGVGWQGFDPTASVPLAPDAGQPTPAQRLTAVAPALLAAVAVAALAGALTAGGLHLLRPHPRRSWADDAVARLEALGARIGRPRRASETLIEYGEALDRTALAGAGAPAVSRAVSRRAFGVVDEAADAALRSDAEEALAVLELAAAGVLRSGRWRWRIRVPLVVRGRQRRPCVRCASRSCPPSTTP